MSIQDVYKTWIKNVKEPELLRDLIKIKDNEKEKHDRFYKFLEFGTAGLRGIMSAGENRVNIHTIRKVTQGFALYLLERYKAPSIAISYDSRNRSKLFAYSSAEVMAANGIKVYITSELQPTPFLSFAVRYLNCSAGIMITASHNTSKYNGYKCYGKDGAQITEKTAKDIYSKILSVDIFQDVKFMKIQDGLRSGLISYMNKNVIDAYTNNVMVQKINNVDFSNLNVIYTPLNGCGNKLVCKVLKLSGVKKLTIVEEQKYPNGNFSTCRYPNPETFQAFKTSLKYASDFNADIIIATDPDADRLGACVKNKKTYKFLTGNEIGILMFYYIIKKKKEFLDFSRKLIIIKTMVSSKMINAIAKKEHCEVIEVPTGFKNIANEISVLENRGELSRFVFAFEESNGYLCGTYTRDKDAISASLLLCEVASYFKRNNLSLKEALDKLNQKYGYYTEKNISFEFDASGGKEKINAIILNLKKAAPENLGNIKVIRSTDYSKLNNFSGEMISLDLGNETEIIIRPSGTEPKLKVYILVHEENKKSLDSKMNELIKNVKDLIDKLVNEV